MSWDEIHLYHWEITLRPLLKKKCPNSIKLKEISSYKGKRLALDASIYIYQFLISTQSINLDTSLLTCFSSENGSNFQKVKI